MKLLSLLLSITLAVTQNVDSIVNQSIQSGDIPGAVVYRQDFCGCAFSKAESLKRKMDMNITN